MPLVPVKDLLERAEAGGYGVGAFNCNNMEIIQAIISAAEKEKSPVIVQASQGAINYAGLEYITALTQVAADNTLKGDYPFLIIRLYVFFQHN
jgi:fructose-bisphosphate aldolase class II